MMVALAVFQACIPFGVFMGIGSLMNLTSEDSRLFTTFILAALVVSFLGSMGAFALIQHQNCGKVKNLQQISNNAGIAFGIQAVTLGIAWMFPVLRTMITDVFPSDIDVSVKDALGYGYYSVWASLFGTAIGGTLSGICR